MNVKHAKLKDVCEIIRGTEPGSKNYNMDGRGYKFIRVSDISKNTLASVFVNVEKDKLKFCEKNDILLVLDGSPGVVYKGIDGAISSGIRIIKIKTDKIIPDFIYYYLQTKEVQDIIKEMANGSIIKHAGKAIDHITIPLISVEHQQKIVSTLSSIDESTTRAKQRIDKNINNAKKLKQGIMNELLTKGIGHTEFKDTEIGKIPKEWEVVKLESACEKIKSGGTPLTSKKEYYGGEIPFTKIDDITNSKKYLYETKDFITEEGLKNSNTWLVPKNSLLLSIYGSLGFVAININEVATNQAILGIIPDKDKIDIEYLYYFFQIVKLQKFAKQTTQANLTAEIIRNLEIPLPSLSEQQQITSKLSTIDIDISNYIDKLTQLKTQLEILKRGTMNKLFEF